MAVAKQRHDRSLVAAHAQLIGSLFSEKASIDVGRFVQRGELGTVNSNMPYMPEVEKKVAEIAANNGKLIIPVEA